MASATDLDSVKVYTVNGAAAGSSSPLPDWLTRKRAGKNGKSKRAKREHYEGTIELIQGFEFPEASNKVKTTRDGHHAIATGTYKPQMHVWDLDQLSLKFERHSDAENVDFIMLSDDWTKSIHLQSDRTVELHTQGGLHYRTRIPRFGRCIAYHFPSCDALFGGAGEGVFRLNLDQGRFMQPLDLADPEADGAEGVNAIDVNPAHQLLAFGMDSNGTVQFWDPRSRARVGVLRLPTQRLSGIGADAKLSVTALSSRADGLSYAVGTSTGHTLLYDVRAAQHYAMKDQGYGLPLKNVHWIEGGARMAGDGMVLSADKKVIKLWDRNTPSTNFASITPAQDLNDVHHVPGSGLLLLANEGIQMGAYYVPQLGPAPRWARFLENITEEMEDRAVPTVYDDYKFVERGELRRLGLDHLVGTPALRPYMHGYFLALKLYDAARVIADPFAYEAHRAKAVQAKLDKAAETRIRAPKNASAKVKVNQALAEKIKRDEERAQMKAARKRTAKEAEKQAEMENEKEGEEDREEKEKPSLLNDPRFSSLFEDPQFAVDESTREYALLNPSAAAQKQLRSRNMAVDDDDEDSDKASSNELGGSDSDGESQDASDSEDSSDAGQLSNFDPRKRPGQKNVRAQAAYRTTRERNRAANVDMVPVRPNTSASRASDPNASFGQRRSKGRPRHDDSANDGATETSWVPSAGGAITDDDALVHGGGAAAQKKRKEKRRGVEEFGAGMEKGGEMDMDMGENERKGRTQRRKGVRSGSKNVFRRIK